jgi:hypothetical protein
MRKIALRNYKGVGGLESIMGNGRDFVRVGK